MRILLTLACLSSTFIFMLQSHAQTLHVVLVADTESEDIRDHMLSGLSELRLALRTNAPEAQLNIKTLDEEAELNERAILWEIRTLSIRPDDAVLFFYMGHGAVDPQLGPYCALQDNRIYFRTITAQLKKLDTTRTVALFDSCQDVNSNLGMVAVDTPEEPPSKMSPLFQKLFFESGEPEFVAWSSAAERQKAVAGRGFGDNFVRTGGLFTLVLSEHLKDTASKRQDWPSLKTSVQKLLSQEFAKVKRLRPDLIQQDQQTISDVKLD